MRYCPRADVLSALVDGECGQDERRDVHAHLQICADCRRTFDHYTRVRELVVSLPTMVAPESFVAASLGRRHVRASVSYALRGPRRYVAAGVAAACIAVSLLGVVAPPEQTAPPVDVFMTRHASVGSNDAGGQIIFSITGR